VLFETPAANGTHLASTLISNVSTEKPIRIGLDGRILMHYEMRGFARYTLELFRAMKEIAGDNIQVSAFSPDPIAREFLAELNIASVVFPARREILWEQIELPRQLQRERIDVFHATANRGLPYRRVCKYVVTCHDVIDRLPEYCRSEHWRGLWRKKYADFISRHSADKYITVSDFSKQDICRFYRLRSDRVIVIHNAANPRFHQKLPAEEIARVRDKYGLPAQYFLFLGGFDVRKNVGALVEGFARLPDDAPPLILAGEHKWSYAIIQEQISALGLQERVLCPDGIADHDLPAVYQGAMALVHPSRYEGFGLQLVEAMASGLPVLASGTTSLPEVLDGCGLLFDPEDPAPIGRQMERIYRDQALRITLAEKGRERARFFSWHRAAEETLTLYLRLLGRSDDVPHVLGRVASEQRR
jgi:glycosyltransferase involved in cell wall biosynthesis